MAPCPGGRPKPRLLWMLVKDSRMMACEVNTHPLGCEVHFYLRGELYCSHAHVTRELAEREADERKRELIAEGWQSPPLSE